MGLPPIPSTNIHSPQIPNIYSLPLTSIPETTPSTTSTLFQKPLPSPLPLYCRNHSPPPIHSTLFKLFHTFPHFFKLFHTFSNFSTLFKTFPHFSTLFHTFPHFFKLFQTFPHFSNFSTLFQTFPQFFKLFKTFPQGGQGQGGGRQDGQGQRR